MKIKCNLIVLKTDKIHNLKNFYNLLGINFVYHRHNEGVLDLF
jgi:nitrate reductase NapAB chaperone NapD